MKFRRRAVVCKVHLSVLLALNRRWEECHRGDGQLILSPPLPEPYDLASGYDRTGLCDLDGVEVFAEVALSEGRLEFAAGVQVLKLVLWVNVVVVVALFVGDGDHVGFEEGHTS